MRRAMWACVAMSALAAGPASAETITFAGTAGTGPFITDLLTNGSQASIANSDIDFIQGTSITLPVSGSCGTFGCLNLVTGPLDLTQTTTTATGGVNYVYGPTGTGSGLIVSGDVGGGPTTLFFAPFVGPINLDIEHSGGIFTGYFTATLGGGILDPGLAGLLGVGGTTLSGGGFDIVANFTQDPTTKLFFGQAAINDYHVSVSAVPEPASASLLLLGTGMVGLARRRFTTRRRDA